MFVLLSALAIAAAQPPKPAAAPVATFGSARLVATIDTGKLKGEPTELAWSPDGTQLLLQTEQRGGDGMPKKPRFLLLSKDSSQPSSVDTPPDWAKDYWSWKSGKSGPGTTEPEIDISASEETTSASQAPMGGSAYGGGGVDAVSGTTIEGSARRSEQTQKQRVVTLSLNGQTIGRFVNQPFLPGYTFGWSPQEQGMIAYADVGGHLAVMAITDTHGAPQALDASKGVILPAWSPDGKTIAYLQKAGKNRWDLFTVAVTTGDR